MELWIRTQNKKTLLKVDMININSIRLISNGYVLGEYKTNERALEVLDEIQDLIKPKIITTNYECEIKENLSKLNFDLEMIPQKTEIKELSTYVYEMPKE